MPIICWGNLAKSANDTQRIEQAIGDYVEGHNENANAHQIEGSSLYMHRVNADLDHLDYSIRRLKFELGLGSGAIYKTLDTQVVNATGTVSSEITDVDMASYVPVNTTAVILDVGVEVGSLDMYVELWKKGDPSSEGHILRECQVAGIFSYTTVVVGLDTDRKFQYAVAMGGGGSWNLDIRLLGYFIKIS